MPLSQPAEREKLHTRRYEFGGYRRSDGLWDIEGRMTDTKTYAFRNEYRGEIEPGVPLHDMSIRLTVDENLVVQDIEAETDAAPYGVCPAITPNFKRMIGVRVGRGWRQKVRETLGGIEGCTHLVEMLQAMATVAFQSLYPVLVKKVKDMPRNRRSPLIDTCHAFKSDGEIVKKTWPDHYTGERDGGRSARNRSGTAV
jgi:hypothetical protein